MNRATRHPDHLGNSRFASTSTRTMYSDVAYAPFGESYAQAGSTDLSFTGQNQDTASNLYDFPAREYGIQGRWPSPDPAGLAAVNLTDPQSWNRFSYVRNSPMNLIDPFGLDPCQGFNVFEFSQDANGTGIFTPEDCAANGGSWGFLGGGGSGGSGSPGNGTESIFDPTPGCEPIYDDNGSLTGYKCDPQNSTGGRGPTAPKGSSGTTRDRLSAVLGQNPELRVCIGQANNLFNQQTQNAGVNTNVSDQTRNFNLQTAFGVNNGMGRTSSAASFLLGLLRGGSVLRGVQNVVIVAGARSGYAVFQTFSPVQYFKDVLQANTDYNQQVAACHQAYGN